MANLHVLNARESLKTLTTVLLPPVVKGPIVRRPRAVGLLDRMGADDRAVEQMQRLRDEHGPDPVVLNLFGRRFALVLDPEDVHRVLNESPEPFSPASLEKRGALGHFQPRGVLVSSATDRLARRPFNESVLQPGPDVHPAIGIRMAEVAVEEAEALLGHVAFHGALDWDSYVRMWQRVVRRVVLGDAARDDHQVTDDLLALRRLANFSYLAPRRPALRERFLGRLDHYIREAEHGSLARLVAETPAPQGTAEREQIPQWLFAFDAGTWASFRALALLTAHPDRAEAARGDMGSFPDLPSYRSAMLESLRLWPTTPLILRDATQDTQWRAGQLDKGASVVLFAPFFHRDDARLGNAHTFDPDQWMHARTDEDWPLVPFSGGPAMCPGRNVVLLVASTVLSRLGSRSWEVNKRLDPSRLPGLLDPFTLAFR